MSPTFPTCPDCGAAYVVLAVTIESREALTRIWACKSCGKSFTVAPSSWWQVPLALTIVAAATAFAFRHRLRERQKASRLASAAPGAF